MKITSVLMSNAHMRKDVGDMSAKQQLQWQKNREI